MSGRLADAQLASQVRMLLQAALLLFIITVVIGILNGTDLVDFTHKQLMTHVHAGTLGWITLAAMAGSMWLFGSGRATEGQLQAGRLVAGLATLIVPLYVLAFFTTQGYARPAMGVATAAVFFLFFGWVATRIRDVELTVPHLGILAAVTSSAVGAILGVLLGLQLASGTKFLPEDGEDAHPAMMVIGFLVPIGMSLSELALRAGKDALPVGRSGQLQIALPFVGGILVMLGILLDATPLLGLSLPFEIVGILIYLKRLWPDLRNVNWLGGAQERFCALTAISLPLDIAWVTYLIVHYEGDLDLAPDGYILALDHLMFIGVVTNAVFALMTIASVERRHVLPWADGLIVLGTSVPLAIFVIGLIADESVLKQIGTPFMGVAILLGILTFTLRLQMGGSSQQQAPSTA
jgi:hypothetical protein